MVYNQTVIPKKLHQIWIGEVEMPQDWKSWCNTVIQSHPNWEYKLWTNDDIQDLIDGQQYLQNYYELVKKLKRWGWMTDVLRYLILYKFGGVYADCDFEMQPNKSFDELPLNNDLLLVNTAKHPKYEIQNCLMGSAPNNEFLKILIENIGKRKYAIKKTPDKILEYYAVKYLTTEYYLYITEGYDGSIPIKVINEDISKRLPKNHVIMDRSNFFGKDAKIAVHFNEETHMQQNLWKFTKNLTSREV